MRVCDFRNEVVSGALQIISPAAVTLRTRTACRSPSLSGNTASTPWIKVWSSTKDRVAPAVISSARAREASPISCVGLP